MSLDNHNFYLNKQLCALSIGNIVAVEIAIAAIVVPLLPTPIADIATGKSDLEIFVAVNEKTLSGASIAAIADTIAALLDKTSSNLAATAKAPAAQTKRSNAFALAKYGIYKSMESAIEQGH